MAGDARIVDSREAHLTGQRPSLKTEDCPCFLTTSVSPMRAPNICLIDSRSHGNRCYTVSTPPGLARDDVGISRRIKQIMPGSPKAERKKRKTKDEMNLLLTWSQNGFVAPTRPRTVPCGLCLCSGGRNSESNSTMVVFVIHHAVRSTTQL